MKKENKFLNTLRYLFLSLVFVTGLITIIGTGGCGGGSSSGGGGGGGGSTSLTTGEFTKTVTLASDSGWSSPFTTINCKIIHFISYPSSFRFTYS